MRYDPALPRRPELGDGRALHAAYVLDAMQPYPGDPWSVLDDGFQPRFIVAPQSAEKYIVYDTFKDISATLPKELLDNTKFRIAEWFACRLSRQERRSCGFTWTISLGNSRNINAEAVLRSGISELYPSGPDVLSDEF